MTSANRNQRAMNQLTSIKTANIKKTTGNPAGNMEDLFYAFLRAETEDEVTAILQTGEMLNECDWKPLGDTENNWAAAGNQQSAASAALVEKIVNGIDAVLIY